MSSPKSGREVRPREPSTTVRKLLTQINKKLDKLDSSKKKIRQPLIMQRVLDGRYREFVKDD